jgi:predicted TIM-barrel fold metal-dependent hydrolase
MSNIRRIDCHVHYLPSAFGEQLSQHRAGRGAVQDIVAGRPGWRDLRVHVELMKKADVDFGVIVEPGSLLEGLRKLGGNLNETVEAYNRSMSADLAPSQGKFLAAASVNPFGGKEAIHQLERSLSLPAMAAIGLVASYGGIALDDPVFEPIFQVARDRDVPILVHPSTVPDVWMKALRLDNMFLRGGFGFFMDDALCILRMATNGTFDRYPDVRFMFCQLGGMTPICCGRWEYHRRQARRVHEGRGEALPAWARKTLGEYLSHLWLDTHTQDRHALSLVMAEAGDHVIVLGGDYPYTLLEEGILYTMGELAALDVPAHVRRKIECENALKLLGSSVKLPS